MDNNLETASLKPVKIKVPSEFLHNLCPTRILLRPDESTYLTSDISNIIFLYPSVFVKISSDFNCGETKVFNLGSSSLIRTYFSCLSTENFIRFGFIAKYEINV